MAGTIAFKKFDAAAVRAFLSRWLAKEPACIGLDVGSSSVKGVLLKKGPAGFSPPPCALEEIPPPADPAARRSGLQSVLRQLSAEKRPVLSAVGGPGTILRPVAVPKMTLEELKTSLHFEAEKYIPFKLEEVFLDSAILRDQPGGRMEILIAAARKEVVQGHVDLLTSTGITPRVVDLEPIALANAWAYGPPADLPDGPVGEIHAGARGTILNFFSGKELQFTREIPIGGDLFTRRIADGLGIDLPKAEQVKRQPGGQTNEVRLALQPIWDEWANQCRASLDFYENQYGRRVERLFLSGGSAPLAGFAEWMGETLGLPVQTWDPLGAGPRLAVAAGLAIRGISSK